MNDEYSVDSESERDFPSYPDDLGCYAETFLHSLNNHSTPYNYPSQPQPQEALLDYPPPNPTPQPEASQMVFRSPLYNYSSQPQPQEALLDYPPPNPTPQPESSQTIFLSPLYNYSSQPQPQEALLDYPPPNPTPQPEASQTVFRSPPYNYSSQPQPQEASLDYPPPNSTPQPESSQRVSVNNKQWEKRFRQKMDMMHWKKQGKDWDGIIEEFAKRGIHKKNKGCWYSSHERFSKEVRILSNLSRSRHMANMHSDECLESGRSSRYSR
jgi:hypothetical protein